MSQKIGNGCNKLVICTLPKVEYQLLQKIVARERAAIEAECIGARLTISSVVRELVRQYIVANAGR